MSFGSYREALDKSYLGGENTVASWLLTKDHKRIAKRYSGGTWIPLEPGYTVRGSEPGSDYNKLTVEFNPAAALQSH